MLLYHQLYTMDFLSAPDEMGEYYIEQLYADTKSAQVLVFVNGIRVVLSVSVGELPKDAKHDNAKQSWIRTVSRAKLEHNNDHQVHLLGNNILSPIRTLEGELIINKAAQQSCAALPCTLSEMLFSPVQFFKLVSTQNNGLAIKPLDADEAHAKVTVKEAHLGAHDLTFTIDPSLKEYDIDDIEVLESLRSSKSGGHIACRVRVDGKDMFCKAERGGIAFGDSGVGYDFKRMLAIREGLVRLPGLSLRIPKLLGYLRHPEEGHVVGFLREWIPGWNLASRPIHSVSHNTLLVWDSKVADTVTTLHAIGAVWGGGDPGSVVIDEHNEPWLIDFSSGVASGWRDEDCDDVEGDWRGVDKIARYLGLLNDSEDEDAGEAQYM